MSSRVIKVAQDGAADFRTVQQAIDAVPDGNTRRTVIQVAPGVYRQPVYVPKKKNLIKLEGISPEATVMTWHNTATKIDHHRAHETGTGTFWSGSVIVEGDDFSAEKITFENSAPRGSEPAVALRVTADRCEFNNCRFIGWQDTLYLHSGRQYLKDCYIEGNVDFICGNGTALLDQCQIHCKSDGFITAQKRESSQETTGFVFSSCTITGTGEKGYTYLGRPWGPFATVLMAYTKMDACVKPVGWIGWPEKPMYEGTARFYEYKCDGPGSSRSQRVTWSKELTDEEAKQFFSQKFDPDPKQPWLAEKMAAAEKMAVRKIHSAEDK